MALVKCPINGRCGRAMRHDPTTDQYRECLKRSKSGRTSTAEPASAAPVPPAAAAPALSTAAPITDRVAAVAQFNEAAGMEFTAIPGSVNEAAVDGPVIEGCRAELEKRGYAFALDQDEGLALVHPESGRHMLAVASSEGVAIILGNGFYSPRYTPGQDMGEYIDSVEVGFAEAWREWSEEW